MPREKKATTTTEFNWNATKDALKPGLQAYCGTSPTGEALDNLLEFATTMYYRGIAMKTLRLDGVVVLYAVDEDATAKDSGYIHATVGTTGAGSKRVGVKVRKHSPAALEILSKHIAKRDQLSPTEAVKNLQQLADRMGLAIVEKPAAKEAGAKKEKAARSLDELL